MKSLFVVVGVLLVVGVLAFGANEIAKGGTQYDLTPAAPVASPAVAAKPTSATKFVEEAPTPPTPAPNEWHFGTDKDSLTDEVITFVAREGVSEERGMLGKSVTDGVASALQQQPSERVRGSVLLGRRQSDDVARIRGREIRRLLSIQRRPVAGREAPAHAREQRRLALFERLPQGPIRNLHRPCVGHERREIDNHVRPDRTRRRTREAPVRQVRGDDGLRKVDHESEAHPLRALVTECLPVLFIPEQPGASPTPRRKSGGQAFPILNFHESGPRLDHWLDHSQSVNSSNCL